MNSITQKAKKLMYERTLKNKAPEWLLTEIIIKKGKELSRKHKAKEWLVTTALYLAHTVFDTEIKGRVQMNHEQLSVRFVKKYLDKWQIGALDQKIIINSILAHHNKIPTESPEAEIVKNAECFKFLTVEGCLIYLHDLGRRGLFYGDSVKQMLYKMDQKYSYLSLKDCKLEGKKNRLAILKIFKSV